MIDCIPMDRKTRKRVSRDGFGLSAGLITKNIAQIWYISSFVLSLKHTHLGQLLWVGHIALNYLGTLEELSKGQLSLRTLDL